MYLVERLISLAIYAFFLLLICNVISHTAKRDNSRILNIYILLLGIMGYCFVPHTGADLTRLLMTMKFYSSKSFSELSKVLPDSATPGVGLYFFAVGKLGNDKLLPCLSAIITFSICFSLLKHQADEKDVKQYHIAAALFLFMSRGLMMQIISNIRTIMALSICAWCVYQEFYEQTKLKKLVIPYIVAASLHIMGQVILIYRLIYLIIEKGKNPVQKVLRLASAGVCAIFIWLFGNSYITALVTKADGYYDAASLNEGYSYFWEGVLCVFTLIILMCMIISYRKNKCIINRNNLYSEIEINSTTNLVCYILPLVVVDIIAGFVEFNFFQRVNWFLTILMIPLCVQLLKLGEYTENEKTLRSNITIVSVIMLILACARGDLCSLKFFAF